MCRMDSPALKLSPFATVLDWAIYIFRHAMSDGDSFRKSLSFHHSPIGKGAVDFFRGKDTSRNALIALGDCVVMRVKRAQAGVLIAQYLRKISLIESSFASIKLMPQPYDRLPFLRQSSNEPERPANDHQHSLADKAP